MELDNNNLKNNNNPVSEQPQQPIFLSDSNYSNKPYNIDDHFPFEVPSPKNSLVQHDFHHQQFHAHGPSSNPMYGVQTGCNFNSYDASTNNNINLYDYEFKPLANKNNNNFGHCQVMEDLLSLSPQHMSKTLQETKNINFVVPGEVSSVTANDFHMKVYMNMNKNKALQQPYAKSRNRKKNNVVKGQWTADEDRRLIQLVDQFGVRKWSHIAQTLPGRIGKQCRERWHNHLRPDIKKDTWSEEEDQMLIQAHSEIGNKWAEIAKRLPGRTENSIKNHWNATKRRQYSKRKCRSKYPRGDLLQEYIKSLNLDRNSAGKFPGKSSSSVSDALASNSVGPTQMKVPGLSQQLQVMDFCQNNDRLVPNFDFNEVPDFDFDDKMFQEDCSIDSLLDDIPCAPELPNKALDLDLPVEDGALLMDFEVKKEMDLLEMISQSRNI